MSQCHRIKGETTYKLFQEQYFLRERTDFGLFKLSRNFRCTNTNINTLKERKKKKKCNRSPVKFT